MSAKPDIFQLPSAGVERLAELVDFLEESLEFNPLVVEQRSEDAASAVAYLRGH